MSYRINLIRQNQVIPHPDVRSRKVAELGDLEMEPRITKEVLEGYLNCKLKGYLKLKGERGTRSDYETLMTALRDDLRARAYEKLLARHAGAAVLRGVKIETSTLKKGASIILDAVIEDEALSLHLDGLMRVEGPSRLGGYHYIPILVVEGEKLGRDQKRLLETLGLIVGELQAKQPVYGIVIRGRGLKMGKVQFKPGSRLTRRGLEEAERLAAADSPPTLILNDHCQVCEFRQRCHLQAVNEDNLSLLRSMGPKEIKSYARKGIFTITQLAHTFRPRRKGKRAERRSHHRYHALNALAIRDKFIYIFGTPQIPTSSANVFVDIEGKPDEGFVYLIGMIIIRDGVEERRSFWANTQEEESQIFEQFLDEMEKLNAFVLFSYGGYEKAFFKRMKNKTDRHDLVDQVLRTHVNILSSIYLHFYFPCHSNSLKDVGRCLGFSWSEIEASGIQSVAWRMRWESTKDQEWKQKLMTYNLEDCLALKKVTDFICAVCSWTQAGAEKPVSRNDGPQVALVHEIDRLTNIRKWGKNKFVHPEFNFINDCAYFDYQRERVFVRTSKTLRKHKSRKTGVHRNRTLRATKDYIIVNTTCPSCNSADLEIGLARETSTKSSRVKRAFDLVVTPGGVRRKVIQCRSPIHHCRQCGLCFVPQNYQSLDKHFHQLKSWAIYLHVAHRISCETLEELFKEFFNLSVFSNEIYMFMTMLARMYQPTYRKLMDRILASRALHPDETEVKLKKVKGYVWVFASLEEVVYMYRATRDGTFLLELLKNFHGVLVSDFYAAYDAIECPQQKCLIHLIRDINQDLLSNPFDEELRSITQSFGTLLQAIVSTVDQHGLKRRFLKVHEESVESFFGFLNERSFTSEVAQSLRDRFLKNREKLFTFIRYDGVSWNNNIAENAIKRFAYYRDGTKGRMGEAGLNDYLVLLSICQTCRLRRVSFLKFLLSRELDLDAFCEGKRTKERPPLIEVYPEGFFPPHLASVRKPRIQTDSSASSDQMPLQGGNQTGDV